MAGQDRGSGRDRPAAVVLWLLLGATLLAIGLALPTEGCTFNCPVNGCSGPLYCPPLQPIASLLIILGVLGLLAATLAIFLGGRTWLPFERLRRSRAGKLVDRTAQFRWPGLAAAGVLLLLVSALAWNSVRSGTCTMRCEYYLYQFTYVVLGVFALGLLSYVGISARKWRVGSPTAA